MTERQFTNKGHYFVLIEESGWLGVYNPQTGQLDRGEPFGRTKTHIIVTHSVMKGDNGADHGMQLLRFHGDSASGPWELASNPYAGVYLTKGEWAQVFKSYGIEDGDRHG